MHSHSGEYSVSIFGTYVPLLARVVYHWTKPEPATRWQPASGGAELKSIALDINGAWVTITDWPEDLVDSIHANIAKEHSQYYSGDAA